jgi:hypothetical protein
MGDTLKLRFVKIAPRERGGAIASNRLEYQQNYAIWQFLELYSRHIDFRMFFDYHDDIVVAQPADDPKQLHFYQVKTDRLRDWTETRLLHKTRTKNGAGRSILGKLFAHLVHFGDDTGSLNFVSNARYKLKLRQGDSHTRERIPLNDISPGALDKIRKRVEEEIGIQIESETCEGTFLMVSPLSLTEHDVHVLGKLAKFMEDRFGDSWPASTVFRVLKNQVRRLQISEDNPTAFEDLAKSKSFSVGEFDDMLQGALLKRRFPAMWGDIRAALYQEDFRHSEVEGLRRMCERYMMERLDPANDTIQYVGKAVRNAIKEMASEAGHYPQLRDELSHVVRSVSDRTQAIKGAYSEDYLTSIVLVEKYAQG